MGYANVEDLRAYRREYDSRPENKAKRRAYMIAWSARHPDYYRKYAGRYNKSQAFTKAKEKYRLSGRQRANDYRRLYGITIAQYDAMLLRQGGVCALCGSGKPGGRSIHFHVDRSHANVKRRGRLCISCNVHVGWLENRKFKIEEYLK